MNVFILNETLAKKYFLKQNGELIYTIWPNHDQKAFEYILDNGKKIKFWTEQKTSFSYKIKNLFNFKNLVNTKQFENERFQISVDLTNISFKGHTNIPYYVLFFQIENEHPIAMGIYCDNLKFKNEKIYSCAPFNDPLYKKEVLQIIFGKELILFTQYVSNWNMNIFLFILKELNSHLSEKDLVKYVGVNFPNNHNLVKYNNLNYFNEIGLDNIIVNEKKRIKQEYDKFIKKESKALNCSTKEYIENIYNKDLFDQINLYKENEKNKIMQKQMNYLPKIIHALASLEETIKEAKDFYQQDNDLNLLHIEYRIDVIKRAENKIKQICSNKKSNKKKY